MPPNRWMMSLLPSRSDAEPAADAGPRVIGVDSEEADDVLSALSSNTARTVLAALHDDPAPPSEVADQVDTSLQNVQYHLENLQNAGAIEVVDTAYSAKGREMDVYAPADQPLVVFAGDESQGTSLRRALTRLLGSLGVLALVSLAVEAFFGRGSLFGDVLKTGGSDGGNGDFGAAPPTETAAGGGDGGAGGAVAPPETATPQPTAAPETTQPALTDGGDAAREATTTVADTATAATTDAVRTTADVAGGAGPPPGLVFFAGGLFVLAVVAVVLYASRQ